MKIIQCVATIATLLIAGCGSPSEKEREIHLTVTSEIRISQRTTVGLPGSEGAFLLTIDDITRGQVMVSIAPDQGEMLVGPRSLSEGDDVVFEVAGIKYRLLLKDLDNELLGDDTAEFVITYYDASKDMTFSATEEITLLITALKDLDGAVMIRNGKQYPVEEGVSHLMEKCSSANGSIETAEDFITLVASESSLTGKPYRIRFEDGRTVTAEEWFKQQLSDLRNR